MIRLFALCLILLPSAAYAWGHTGHRITAKIAEHHLSDEARAAISAILGPETLAEASGWPDDMRSSPEPFWQVKASPWHYVTVPDGIQYKPENAPDEGDAVTALQQFSQTLQKDEASLAEKQLALRFIIHIIGDLHQPLHAGNGTDRGGNDVAVTFFWQDSNLHRVWDSGLIDRQRLSFTEWSRWLNAKITKDQKQRWANTDPVIWIAESTEIRDRIYPESPDINWDYQFEMLPIIKQRLSMAGIRIAAYLNDLFATPSEP